MVNGSGSMVSGLVAALGVSAILGGCGETTKGPSAASSAGVSGSATMPPQNGGTAAVSGGAPGSAGTGLGGTDDGGEPAIGTAGEGGAAGAPQPEDPLLTSWVYINEHDPWLPDIEIDECWNLQVYPPVEEGGMWSIAGIFPSPEHRVTYLVFSQGAYSGVQMTHGPSTASYPAECLVTDAGSPTCAQLQESLLLSGIGEGSVRQVQCEAGAAGGCDCEFAVTNVFLGVTGAWSRTPDDAALTITRDYPEPSQLTFDYQLDAAGLHTAAPLGDWLPGTSDQTFVRVDCQDGQQGPGELVGPDCGTPCEAACP